MEMQTTYKKTSKGYRLGQFLNKLSPHIVLGIYTIIALFPIFMIVINSFKSRNAIFGQPFALPSSTTFSLIGYQTVFSRANFGGYFINSIIVTGLSLILTLLIGAMAAYALSEYNFKGNTFLGLYLSIGIMIPIRLGSVSLLRLMSSLNLVNTLTALILIYIASGLPMTIFILSQFMRSVPRS
jgi:raffinose/stachyose/melibiose transport system permease protein